MNRYTFYAKDKSDTDRLGACLATVIPDGTTVALIGTLGSGKTFLVQAIAETCGIEREHVVSPTFVLYQPYRGRRLLHHIDAYRIADDDEFLELGPDEYFESDGVTFVEWADRVAQCLPAERIEIRIDVKGNESREFQVAAIGEALECVLQRLKQQLDA